MSLLSIYPDVPASAVDCFSEFMYSLRFFSPVRFFSLPLSFTDRYFRKRTY